MSNLPCLAAATCPPWSECLRHLGHVVVRPCLPADADGLGAFRRRIQAHPAHFRLLGQVRGQRAWSRGPDGPANWEVETGFVAVVVQGGLEQVAGTSRYATDSDGLHCECAVTVDPDRLATGLATLLMRHLIEVARARGIRRMYSFEYADNAAMNDLVLALGFRTRVAPGDVGRLIHERAL